MLHDVLPTIVMGYGEYVCDDVVKCLPCSGVGRVVMRAAGMLGPPLSNCEDYDKYSDTSRLYKRAMCEAQLSIAQREISTSMQAILQARLRNAVDAGPLPRRRRLTSV